ncbi:Imm58 family immunity protein [Comamonas sp.]|uniref:Imm58 family immunity protein n=1 Tax=Comamonas sp. TaxID=34028 RepID=UPI0028996DE3|nr:Imm58 family immunity protein [Comamonas sp.]
MSLYKKISVLLILPILIAALLSSAIFAYLWIDRSISLSYMEASFITSENTNQHLLFMLNNELKGKSNQEITRKLEAIVIENPNKNLFIKSEDDHVWFGEIKFEFKHNRLKEISG